MTYPVELVPLTLYKHVSRGIKMDVDVTCGSNFMLQEVRSISRAIRTQYHWVIFVYLVLDNAGDYDTSMAKQTFARTLKRRFNAVCM